MKKTTGWGGKRNTRKSRARMAINTAAVALATVMVVQPQFAGDLVMDAINGCTVDYADLVKDNYTGEKAEAAKKALKVICLCQVTRMKDALSARDFELYLKFLQIRATTSSDDEAARKAAAYFYSESVDVKAWSERMMPAKKRETNRCLEDLSK